MEYRQFEDRDSYRSRQIGASTGKFAYCKTSFRDVRRYLDIIRHDRAERAADAPLGPILCLGVRNGREVDLFRVALSSSAVRQHAVQTLERRRHGVNSWMPVLERFGRRSYQRLDDTSCIGVEINPLVARPDVWVGSFDSLPQEWIDRFGVVFSNSFDHAFDPYSTAAAWCRVVRPRGYFVLDFPEQQYPAPLDPVGRLSLKDVDQLFPGELIYYRHRGSVMRYTEFVIRMS